MEKILLTLGLIALLGATIYMTTEDNPFMVQNSGSQIDPPVYDLYQHWKTRHNKKYSSPVEDQYRFTVFNDNYNTIKSIEEGPKKTYKLNFNQFMDITPQEFKETYLGLKLQQKETFLKQERITQVEALKPVENAVKSIDWRDKGVLNEVRNQGQCGSCWAFSAIGALESAYAVQGKGLLELSEQELVDCSISYGNLGCQGGLIDYAFQYIIEKGISSRVDYPYVGRDEKCQKLASIEQYRLTEFKDVPKGNCSALEQAISQRPISVAVDASNWQFYSSGVFTDCDNKLNHAVILVASDATEWTIRNSWATGWGESGHIRLTKGDTCGICQMASYPVV